MLDLTKKVAALMLVGSTLGAPCGCAHVHLISNYDPVIDQGVTDVHARIASFVTRMNRLAGTPEGTYAPNAGFYDDIEGMIVTLKLRADMDPQNQITCKMLGELEQEIADLKGLHRVATGGLPHLKTDSAMSGIDVTYRAIVKLERAKQHDTN
jgi:hypothetical protein